MSAEIRFVAPVERELLVLARTLFADGGFLSVESMLVTRVTLDLLGPTAMGLLEDTLAKGAARFLLRASRGGPRFGPDGVSYVFDRAPPPALEFGAYSFELLRWLATTSLVQRNEATFKHAPKTAGDELMAYLAVRLVASTRFESVVAAQPGIQSSVLAWVGHPRALALAERATMPARWTRLVTPQERDNLALVVECLGPDLTRGWLRTAQAPVGRLDPERAAAIGRAEVQATCGFIDAVLEAKRYELASFAVDAVHAALRAGESAEVVAARALPLVQTGTSLRARTEARRQAGAVYRAVARLARAHDELGLVRFFEDGYDEAQAALARWERLGKDGFARAVEVVAALDRLGDLEVPEAPATDAGGSMPVPRRES